MGDAVKLFEKKQLKIEDVQTNINSILTNLTILSSKREKIISAYDHISSIHESDKKQYVQNIFDSNNVNVTEFASDSKIKLYEAVKQDIFDSTTANYAGTTYKHIHDEFVKVNNIYNNGVPILQNEQLKSLVNMTKVDDDKIMESIASISNGIKTIKDHSFFTSLTTHKGAIDGALTADIKIELNGKNIEIKKDAFIAPLNALSVAHSNLSLIPDGIRDTCVTLYSIATNTIEGSTKSKVDELTKANEELHAAKQASEAAAQADAAKQQAVADAQAKVDGIVAYLNNENQVKNDDKQAKEAAALIDFNKNFIKLASFVLCSKDDKKEGYDTYHGALLNALDSKDNADAAVALNTLTFKKEDGSDADNIGSYKQALTAVIQNNYTDIKQAYIDYFNNNIKPMCKQYNTIIQAIHDFANVSKADSFAHHMNALQSSIEAFIQLDYLEGQKNKLIGYLQQINKFQSAFEAALATSESKMKFYPALLMQGTRHMFKSIKEYLLNHTISLVVLLILIGLFTGWSIISNKTTTFDSFNGQMLDYYKNGMIFYAVLFVITLIVIVTIRKVPEKYARFVTETYGESYGQDDDKLAGVKKLFYTCLFLCVAAFGYNLSMYIGYYNMRMDTENIPKWVYAITIAFTIGAAIVMGIMYAIIKRFTGVKEAVMEVRAE